jgi:hypothetical protein
MVNLGILLKPRESQLDIGLQFLIGHFLLGRVNGLIYDAKDVIMDVVGYD